MLLFKDLEQSIQARIIAGFLPENRSKMEFFLMNSFDLYDKDGALLYREWEVTI